MNSGTDKLQFQDSSYGIVIKQLDSIPVFQPTLEKQMITLNSHEEKEFVWNQLKNNGEPILEGAYKITSKAITINEDVIEKIITINIFK